MKKKILKSKSKMNVKKWRKYLCKTVGRKSVNLLCLCLITCIFLAPFTWTDGKGTKRCSLKPINIKLSKKEKHKILMQQGKKSFEKTFDKKHFFSKHQFLFALCLYYLGSRR